MYAFQSSIGRASISVLTSFMYAGSSTFTFATGEVMPMAWKYAAHSMPGESFCRSATVIGWSVASGSRRATRVSCAFAISVSTAITLPASMAAAALSVPASTNIFAMCATYAVRVESAAAVLSR